MFKLLLPIALLTLTLSLSQTLLNDDPPSDHSPAWSPDGSHIAFLRSKDDLSALYRINSDGTDPVKLTGDRNADLPSWSPDGKQIAYSDGKAVRVMISDG